MKRITTLSFFLVGVLFAISTGCSGPKEFVMKRPPASPSLKEFPKADAVVLLYRRNIVLSQDGYTYTENVHKQVKALNERGTRFLRGAYVGYFHLQKVKNLHARLIRPNGWISRAYRFSDQTMGDRSKRFFRTGRLKATRFSNVVPGSVKEVRYTKVGATFTLTSNHFQWNIPIARQYVSISVPNGIKFNHKLYSSETYPASNIKYSKQADPNRSNHTLHVWKGSNIPVVQREAAMPVLEKQVTRVEFSWDHIQLGPHKGSFYSWKEIAEFYSNLYKNQTKATAYIKKFTQQLVKKDKTKEDKIRSIYNFVRRDIRYIAISLKIGGWKPQAADFTLRTRYGDCKAKASLMVAMLSSIGVKALPVVVRTRYRGALDPAFATRQFNHVINYLPNYKGGMFVDATTNNNRIDLLRADDQGASGLVIAPNTKSIIRIPAFPASKNLKYFRTTLHVKRKQHRLDGTLVVNLGGVFRIWWDGLLERGELKNDKKRIGFVKEYMLKRYLQAVGMLFRRQAKPKAQIDVKEAVFSTQKQQNLTLTVKYSLDLKKERPKRVWIPTRMFTFGGVRADALHKRKWFGVKFDKRARYRQEVILKGWSALECPDNMSLKNKHFKYDLTCQKGDLSTHWKRDLSLTTDLVPLKEHGSFTQSFLKIRERDRRLIVLKEGSLDKDKDGVADDVDKCPTIPGLAKFNGCPDTDGDGISDDVDKCPNLKGVPHPEKPETHGCPKVVLVKVTDKEIKILQKIFFRSGRARILRKSFPVLDQVIAVLNSRKKIKLQIEGHTDNRGRKRSNKRLSQRRANAVLKYFTKKGIDKERLKAIGFGQEKPLVDNKTSKNRAKNRRVQFTILKDDTKTDAKK